MEVLDLMLADTMLSDACDVRVLTRCKKKTGALDAAEFYKLRTWGGVDAPFFGFVWRNHAPSKVRFFAWLLSKSRIQSRSALLKKKVLTAAETICPLCGAAEETPNHLFFECRFAKRF